MCSIRILITAVRDKWRRKSITTDSDIRTPSWLWKIFTTHIILAKYLNCVHLSLLKFIVNTRFFYLRNKIGTRLETNKKQFGFEIDFNRAIVSYLSEFAVYFWVSTFNRKLNACDRARSRRQTARDGGAGRAGGVGGGARAVPPNAECYCRRTCPPLFFWILVKQVLYTTCIVRIPPFFERVGLSKLRSVRFRIKLTV